MSVLLYIVCDILIYLLFSHVNCIEGNAINTDIVTRKKVVAYLMLKKKATYKLTAEGKTRQDVIDNSSL